MAKGGFSAKKKERVAMKRRYQIEQQRAVQQFRRLATEQNPNIQMVLPLAEIVSLLQQGVGNLLRQTGLELMHLVMDEEVKSLAGERTSSMQDGARTAGAKKMATAWWMVKRCRSGGRDCAARTSGSNGWEVMSCSSAVVRCKPVCGTR
jgi:hypothetical protein